MRWEMWTEPRSTGTLIALLEDLRIPTVCESFNPGSVFPFYTNLPFCTHSLMYFISQSPHHPAHNNSSLLCLLLVVLPILPSGLLALIWILSCWSSSDPQSGSTLPVRRHCPKLLLAPRVFFPHSFSNEELFVLRAHGSERLSSGPRWQRGAPVLFFLCTLHFQLHHQLWLLIHCPVLCSPSRLQAPRGQGLSV